MPPIDDLLGLGRSLGCSFEIADPAIAHDDLDAGVSEQPGSQYLLVTAQEDLDGLVPLQIHQQGAFRASLK